MSAFIVDHGHIDVMVDLAIRGPGGHRNHDWSIHYPVDDPTKPGGYRMETPATDPDATGRMLLAENVLSVRYRYSEEPYELPYSFVRPRRQLTAVEGLMALRCYDYQTCEHPEYERSEAHAFVNALMDRLVATLPGMDIAPWCWTREMAAVPRLG